MPNSHPTDNLAVNRATCSLFIERSLAGIARPCYRCPQSRITQNPDVFGYFNECPCGRSKIPYEDMDMYFGGHPFL